MFIQEDTIHEYNDEAPLLSNNGVQQSQSSTNQYGDTDI